VNNRSKPVSAQIPRARQASGPPAFSEFRREKSRIEDLMHRAPVKTAASGVEKLTFLLST